jgi:hypothetical protein
MIKSLKKPGMEWNSLNLMKGGHENPQNTVLFNMKGKRNFP